MKLFKQFIGIFSVLMLSMTIASPAHAAETVPTPTFSAEKNFMEGTNVTITVGAINPANLLNFKAVESRKIYYFYSSKSDCATNNPYMIGGYSEFDIKASGLNSVSKTVTLKSGNANLYFCAYDFLIFSRTNVLSWTTIYSSKIGALVNPYQIDWSIFVPKLIVIPPLVATETIAPSSSPSPSATASAAAPPTGSKAIFDQAPSLEAKIQVSIKKWDLKGNAFKARTLKLRTCSDAKCETKLDYFDVTASSGLSDSTASSFTMSKLIETKGQYVQILDALTYTDSGTGEEKTVRTYSEIKELIAATEEVAASESATPEVAPSTAPSVIEETVSSTSGLAGVIIGVLATLLLVALVVIVVVLRKKKQEEKPTSV